MKMTKALLASCLFMAAPLMAADYDVDAAHTTVQFKVGHLGFSELVGRFNTFSGTFSMDDANPAAAKASFGSMPPAWTQPRAARQTPAQPRFPRREAVPQDDLRQLRLRGHQG